MEHKLDNIDRKIIEMLQKNARTPVKEIAKEVFLSSPAVSARIEHLEKNGLITGYHAQINPVFLGYHIKAFINLEVEPNQKKDFYPFIQSIPNVIECNCVTGDYSMLIEVAFRSTMELDHFINELQQFGRTKTQIVFSTSVEHRDLPVEQPPSPAALKNQPVRRVLPVAGLCRRGADSWLAEICVVFQKSAV